MSHSRSLDTAVRSACAQLPVVIEHSRRADGGLCQRSIVTRLRGADWSRPKPHTRITTLHATDCMRPKWRNRRGHSCVQSIDPRKRTSHIWNRQTQLANPNSCDAMRGFDDNSFQGESPHTHTHTSHTMRRTREERFLMCGGDCTLSIHANNCVVIRPATMTTTTTTTVTQPYHMGPPTDG